MTSDELFTLKIKALLHDPPEKQLILFREKHEERAKEIIAKVLGSADIPEIVKQADRISSATSRAVLPRSEGSRVNFVQAPILKHPLSGEEYDLRKHGGSLQVFLDKSRDQLPIEAKAAVDSAIESLKLDDLDPKRRFFTLWRCLPGAIRGAEKKEIALGSLWDLIPADSRTPDHSIWDHAHHTSALVTALPKPAFLLFTIGPVQQFIAVARRTQDLWAGSYLLSHLTWKSMLPVVDALGPDVILFPSLFEQPIVDHWLRKQDINVPEPYWGDLLIAGFPNRFLALVPKDQAAQLGKQCQVALEEAWAEIHSEIQRVLGEKAPSLPDEKIWSRQVNGFFESSWIVWPWVRDGRDSGKDEAVDSILDFHRKMIEPPKEFEAFVQACRNLRESYVNVGTAYSLLYDQAERVMGSRKALRPFPYQEEPGWKCSLCGERQALQLPPDNGVIPAETLRKYWSDIAKQCVGDFHPGGRERLCAICTVKRLAGEHYFRVELDAKERYPSISSLAIGPWKARILENWEAIGGTVRAFLGAWEDLKEDLGAWDSAPAPGVSKLAKKLQLTEEPGVQEFLRMDGDWFRKSAYQEASLEHEYGKHPNREYLDRALKALADLLRESVQPPHPHPLPQGERELRKYPIPSPRPYFALLYMDGDSMGEWLSGAKAPMLAEVLHPGARSSAVEEYRRLGVSDLRRPLSPALHGALSSSLRAFSLEIARRVVETMHLGKLIYAGGDDVLAIVPLDSLASCMRDLRFLYSGQGPDTKVYQAGNLEANGGFVRCHEDLWRVMGKSATASMGVSVGHTSHSLGHMAEEARKAEKTAKKHKNKNAFCIRILRRSGEITEAACSFTSQESGPDPLLILSHLTELLRGDVLSSRFIFQMRRAPLPEGLPFEAVEKEFRRLVRRHVQKKEPDALQQVEGLLPDLATLLRSRSWREMTDLLIITQFLARGGRE